MNEVIGTGAAGSDLLPEQGWHKALKWQDGLYMMFPMTCGVFVSSGFMVPALGAWGALIVIGWMGIVALLSNFLFSEMACMFPEKTGGLSMYCREGLRRYFIPGGVLGSFGYWLGYALSICFVALQMGVLIQMQWFANNTWTVNFVGGVQLTMGHMIALGILVLCWLLTILGIKVAARLSITVGAVVIVLAVIVIVGPLFSGHASVSNLHLHLPGWTATLVWCYITGWTLFPSELGATFGPEYKNPKKDLPKVLLSSALFTMFVFALAPFSATAEIGEQTIAQNPLTYGPLAAASVFGGGAQVFTAILVAALGVTVLVFMNDCGRATAGMAEEGECVRQLAILNRFGAPTWGTHLVALVNIFVLLFIANPLGIILASNLGYILSHSLGNMSFLILRKTQPDTPRPVKLKSRLWVPVAWVLMFFHAYILYVGAFHPGLAGYGGAKETLIAVGILCGGLLLWVIRVTVQDRQGLRLRERGPSVQAAGTGGAR
jgi:amino acid transporter